MWEKAWLVSGGGGLGAWLDSRWVWLNHMVVFHVFEAWLRIRAIGERY